MIDELFNFIHIESCCMMVDLATLNNTSPGKTESNVQSQFNYNLEKSFDWLESYPEWEVQLIQSCCLE